MNYVKSGSIKALRLTTLLLACVMCVSVSAQTVGECNPVDLAWNLTTNSEGSTDENIIPLASPIKSYEIVVAKNQQFNPVLTRLIEDSDKTSTRYTPPTCEKDETYWFYGIAVDERDVVSARTNVKAVTHSGGTVTAELTFFPSSPADFDATEIPVTLPASYQQCTENIVIRCKRTFVNN